MDPLFLIIANAGDLAASANRFISSLGHTSLLIVERSSSVEELVSQFLKAISVDNVAAIVYISGETREAQYMLKLNYHFPAVVATVCQDRSLPLVYLSSLAVFGLPRQSSYDSLSEPDCAPSDVYGYSKYCLDRFISSRMQFLSYSAILPASIVKPSSNRSVLVKLWRFLDIKAVRFFAAIACPAGGISMVDIEFLARLIASQLSLLVAAYRVDGSFSPPYRKRIIASSHVSVCSLVADINNRAPLLNLPSVPFFVYRFLSLIFPSNLVKKLCFVFTRVVYSDVSEIPA